MTKINATNDKSENYYCEKPVFVINGVMTNGPNHVLSLNFSGFPYKYELHGKFEK